MPKKLEAIPTHIITGFLGVGKTSAILHLLSEKPEDEVWAVLVNEYGAMGIDADILSGKGAFVEQVPGGCICCAQGLPFEVAINRLVKTVRPDRLIIEPSGLAHPHKIIQQLTRGYFKSLLSIKAVICLLDARHFLDARYTSNEMFVDQIALADIVLANKIDLANETALIKFSDWVSAQKPSKLIIDKITQGKLNITLLQYERNTSRQAVFPHSHSSNNQRHEKKDDALDTWSETFSPEIIFDLEALLIYFKTLDIVRLKAILKTNKGWFVFNQVDSYLSHYAVEKKREQNRQSRIETIGNTPKLILKTCEFK